MPDLNQPAPSFSLKNHALQEVSLEQFKGQTVVLAFYPAAFTGVCEAEMCAFRDAMSQFNDLGATVLGISADGPFANAAFAKKNELNFDLLSDVTTRTIQDYGLAFVNFAGVEGYTASHRAVFVIDGEGNLVYEERCANPGLQPDYAALKAALPQT